jgi:excisionase family DNA binding protein
MKGTTSVTSTPTPAPETWPDLLTVAEAGAYINTSERFARRLVSDRRVQVVKLGKHVRIPRPALDEYVAANTRQPAAAERD